MVDSPGVHSEASINKSLADYSRSLHEYTLRLWTESRRKVEQQAQARAKAERSSMRNSEKRSK
ncbi:uncharacterized protein FOMMEDRAFT_19335 [Fomitiporia mediterranea MF3/22]|uniref:uncharacterized protein n=1 Tax=Fomitiporia mediterranea (strain MF3/22) TaxID=694068 RepID=UPI0004408090|nr:uncharacterized protein FOMMEDRAFT_19335 [Fomitiporia mediterranea MF3/22]EJD04018.1 hypothetical protein FOMMEDRAFT_19335 [Fomitiporia mediterranea MF3/22]